jgi:hypothetical protein
VIAALFLLALTSTPPDVEARAEALYRDCLSRAAAGSPVATSTVTALWQAARRFEACGVSMAADLVTERDAAAVASRAAADATHDAVDTLAAEPSPNPTTWPVVVAVFVIVFGLGALTGAVAAP